MEEPAYAPSQSTKEGIANNKCEYYRKTTVNVVFHLSLPFVVFGFVFGFQQGMICPM